MDICILNKSKRVTQAEAEAMAEACAIQVRDHVAPAWECLPCAVIAVQDEKHVPAGAMVILLIDNPDMAGALGYHTDVRGVLFGKVFVDPVLDNGGAVLHHPGGNTVASVMSHEVIESLIDRYCNSWVDGPPRREGNQYANEPADPVEGDSYEIPVKGKPVTVSNFVYPRWFDPQARPAVGEKLDHMGKCIKPFELTPGGYMVVRQAGGRTSQVFGAEYPAWRQALRSRTHSRTGAKP